MVVFVDYDEEDSYNDAYHHRPQDVEPAFYSGIQSNGRIAASTVTTKYPNASSRSSCVDIAAGRDSASRSIESTGQAETLNLDAFGRSLGCYPVVRELARYLDLNSLDALSRTCRQYRVNLMPFRDQLIKRTLRCENEYIQTLNELLAKGAAIPESIKHVVRLMNQGNADAARLTSGKIGKCARDMVGDCRRCGRVVCRNCTIKPPSAVMLKNRLRRLCTTCQTAPLVDHLSPEKWTSNSESDHPPAFTYLAFARTPCDCENAVWLCQTCGHSLRNRDTTYRRIWTWRTHYSTYLGGGLGTGIGEGCQGVKCGKGADCLAAQVIEVEVDAEADESMMATPDPHNHGHDDHTHSDRELTPWGLPQGRLDNVQHDDTPGYFQQEIVGIGGVVKRKSKKRVAVGACVDEHEDERETGKYLLYEESGQDRACCGWCWRVIPSRKDLEGH
ncbi:uncharacterized protein TRUGW13939_10762 [Talaromyces rugulosus]|uniref:F-box domain-containing protein n=1 Tax=Talaromyces rugulosus TaxID=121627 RepID=A0A7H8RCS6_TALRU|nr:uncharacterized protein TRUGW13939_10762 [Talaromyces rugulosus]QKX63591.1 hypothetical protein TRUGW13939_10762 [Talaromyces rugulosus]